MGSDAKKEIRGGTETILLVEDMSPVRFMVRTALEHYGYKVIETSSPREALEIWQKEKNHIDLILTDIDLPEINGFELVKKIQSGNPAIRVVYMSGYNIEFIEKGLNFKLIDGINFLQKPYLSGKLAKTIRNALDK